VCLSLDTRIMIRAHDAELVNRDRVTILSLHRSDCASDETNQIVIGSNHFVVL
jgi:hypothetical protein